MPSASPDDGPIAPHPARRREELARALESGKLHGAYLFEGRCEPGPLETARWFARLLLCAAPEAAAPCERCPACALTRDAEQNAHPDLHWIRAEGPVLKIDAVRTLQAALSLSAHQGGRRIGVLEGAERLNLSASNALLKLLEEPPSHAVLILVARDAAPLPATVRSRTLRVGFPAESEREIQAALERDGLDAEDARLAAALGGGSRHEAQRWADAHLEEARELRARICALRGQPPSAQLDAAERLRGGDARARGLLFLDVYLALAREQLREGVAASDAQSTEDALRRCETGLRLRRELERRNLNPQLAVERLLLGGP